MREFIGRTSPTHSDSDLDSDWFFANVSPHP